jgi:hypothetical protein
LKKWRWLTTLECIQPWWSSPWTICLPEMVWQPPLALTLLESTWSPSSFTSHAGI